MHVRNLPGKNFHTIEVSLFLCNKSALTVILLLLLWLSLLCMLGNVLLQNDTFSHVQMYTHVVTDNMILHTSSHMYHKDINFSMLQSFLWQWKKITVCT